MLCPFATNRPVIAHGGPIGTILGVVIHVTDGQGDPFNEFVNEANQVSSHFGIGNGQGGMADGELEQYVDTGYESWAQMAGNRNYISVETEGVPSDPLTPAQVATFARLLAWLHQVHGIPLVVTDTPGEPGFITHGDGGVDWGDHIDCPGPYRSLQRAQIIAAAVPPAPTPPPIEEDPSMITTDPVTGTVVATDEDGNFYGRPELYEAPSNLKLVTLGQHPEWKAGSAESGGSDPCVGITFEKDADGSWGYTYITKPASGHGSFGPYNLYHIHRGGSF